MNGRVRERTCKKAFIAFFLALWVLIAFGDNGWAFEEPPAKDSSSAADEVAAISKDIQQTVKGLGYSGDADIDLVQIVSSWEYAGWKRTLGQARQDYQRKKTSSEDVVRAEEKALKNLCEAIQKNFSPAAVDSEYFYLSKVVTDGKAQCLGYSQLLYVLGNALGLTVKVVDVLEQAGEPLPAGEEHSACLVELTGGKTIMVDLTQDGVSKPFAFQDQYGAVGNYWELKQKDNPLKIPRRIQILDGNGILADIYNSLGSAYAKSGKETEAISFFTKAVEVYPKLAKAYSSRGVELFNKGQRTKAVSDLDKAIELDPKDAEAYYNRGTVYAGSRQEAKAISNFTKAIEIKPIFPAVYKSRGSIYAKLGRNSEAIADFAKAIEQSPKDAEAYFFLGVMFNQSGKKDKAVSYFTKALECNPKYVEAYNMRGTEYGKLGKYTDAISDFTKAVDINPKYAQAYCNRGIIYLQLEQYDMAVKYFSRTLEISSKYAEAYSGRGVAYSKLGKFNEARSDFTHVIQYQPKNARAYLNRAIADANLNRNEEAKRDLQKAAELDPSLKDEIKKISDKLK
ncbi:MAG: tetratricopeptide repeat protein [Thermoguttaceae bacterium]